MNFKSLLVVGFGIATLGLSLPAHADTATVITNDQNAVITGDKNDTTQNNSTRVKNNDRRNSDSSGTVIDNRQNADVLGDKNKTEQNNSTDVRNTRVRNR